jgi:beta-lactamase class A
MRTLVLFLITTLLLACATPPKQEPTIVEDRIIDHTPLREKINSIIQDAKAEIGIALIGPEGDTLSIHGDDSFPLMSVAKFPQALTLLHFVDLGKIERNKKIPITDHDFTQKTASSLRKDHPENDVQLSIPEVLAYSLGQSDNITSNVIFDQVGGPSVVDEYISKLGVSGINIGTDYWHLSEDITKNNGTPKAMVLLLQKFYNDSILSEESKKTIWKAMIEATSGKNRIRGLLPAGTLVGHKTGTGNRNETSEISDAFNDAGIILLDNDTHFCLAVFIKNSSESDDTNASIMAQITKSIWDFYQR